MVCIKTSSLNDVEPVYDYITITLLSSEETQADLCADQFATLAIADNTAMSGVRTWEVPATDVQKDPKNILITSQVDLQSIDWECAGQVYQSIDVEIEG
jgi:hypothetical protein